MLRPIAAKASDTCLPSKSTPSNARRSDEVTVRDMPDASRPASFMLPCMPSSSRRKATVTPSSPAIVPSSPANCASSRPRSAS